MLTKPRTQTPRGIARTECVVGPVMGPLSGVASLFSARGLVSFHVELASERVRVREVRPEGESMQAFASRGMCTKKHIRFTTTTAPAPPRSDAGVRPSTAKAQPTSDRSQMKSLIASVVLLVTFAGLLTVFKASHATATSPPRPMLRARPRWECQRPPHEAEQRQQVHQASRLTSATAGRAGVEHAATPWIHATPFDPSRGAPDEASIGASTASGRQRR